MLSQRRNLVVLSGWLALAAGGFIDRAESAPPDLPFNESPADGSVDSPSNALLCVDVSDPDGDALDVTFWARPAAGEDFAIVALPDTQYSSESYPEVFEAQTQWIVENRAARNIVFVTHLGDIVENGSEGNDIEWSRADTVMSRLEDPVATGLPEGIPYGIAPGNHDQTPWNFPRSGPDEGATTGQYNETFGVQRFQGRSYYGGAYRFDEPLTHPDNNDDGYYLFTGGGLEFIVVHLEFDTLDSPERRATLRWLDRLVTLHAERRAIISAHELLDGTGEFRSMGQSVYDTIKDNPNVFLMVCGHVHPEPARRRDEHLGSVVDTLLSDYQEEPNGGNGWLRIMTLSPETDEIHVETYSPWLDDFMTDPANQFTLDYEMPDGEPFALVGTVTGVPSGGTACVPWPGRRKGVEYAWLVRISDGESTTVGSSWSFVSDGTCGSDPDCIDGDPCSTDLCTAGVCEGTHPSDIDGDGICSAQDNCPDIFNVAQADGDGDGIGSLCDLCPEHPDPLRADGDGDGAGDACDCQPDDPYDRQPGRVTGLRMGRPEPGTAKLVWSPAPGADTYSLTRGELAGLASGQYGECLVQGIRETHHDDTETPATGEGFFYLIQAQDFDCGLGSLGYRSSELPRENLDPLACAGHPHEDVRAVDEQTVYGSVSGSYLDTHAPDDVYETITEELSSGGSPSSRYSRLEHRWTVEVAGGSLVEVHIEGFRTDSPDGDNFEFGYSTDDGQTWAPIGLTNLPRTDNEIDLVAELPSTVSGTVLVRVVDTNRGTGNQNFDTVGTDELFVRSVP